MKAEAAIYDLVMRLLNGIVLHASWLLGGGRKARRFAEGQRGLLASIQEAMRNEPSTQRCWIHCSSLGEYAVARPVIRRLRECGWCVVLTLFSASGYDVLCQRKDAADYVFFLPIDTRQNVRRFLDAARPQRAVFIISEYWLGYLNELSLRNIPTYFVSMFVPSDSYLLKWYARPIRQALSKARCLMVLDEESKSNLEQVGLSNVRVVGDPLFDNAAAIARSEYQNAVIERFCENVADILVAGSVSDDNDVEIVCGLANSRPELKMIVAPHETDERQISTIAEKCGRRTLRYSQCDDSTSFDDVQILIIDYIGDLARIYRYGRYAYVGGGFTPYLHSVLEPAAYGLPIAFGPRIERKATALQMIAQGFAAIVETQQDVCDWFASVRDAARYNELHCRALDYVAANANATEVIIKELSRKETEETRGAPQGSLQARRIESERS